MTGARAGVLSDAELRDALAVIAELRPLLDGATESYGLNAAEVAGVIPVSTLPLTRLTAAADGGNLLELRVVAGDWSVDVRQEGSVIAIEPSGPWSDVADDKRRIEMERAIAQNDVARLLRQLDHLEATVRYRVKHNVAGSGFHWVATADRLARLVEDGWLEVGATLAADASVLLVDDLGKTVSDNGYLAICGPEALDTVSAPAVGSVPRVIDREFTVTRVSPWRFAQLRASSAQVDAKLDRVRSSLNAVAVMQIWTSLATSADVGNRDATLVFLGPRKVTVAIAARPQQDIAAELALYSWVAAGVDGERLDFAQQALSLAVIDSKDLDSAAVPALGTARSLYELSRKGAVAEALATRRAARDAAAAAGRAAAVTARDTAGKSVERVTVQLVAAVGVLVAHWREALTVSQARWLLGLILLICVATLVLTVRVTLRSASRGLDDELTDLDYAREALSGEEIAKIKASGAVTAARSDISRAKATAWTAFAMATVLVMIAALFLPGGGTSEPPTEDLRPSEQTTTSPTPPEESTEGKPPSRDTSPSSTPTPKRLRPSRR